MESYNTSETGSFPLDVWNYSSNQSREPRTPDEIFLEEKIRRHILVYVIPVIVAVGTTGNVLSFFVLLHSRMRSTSVYFYLMILACADTTVLYVSAFKTWIRVITKFELLHACNACCTTTYFVQLIAFHMAAWIIVLITLDRFIVVWFPFKANTMCTLSRARLAVIILLTVFSLYNVHIFWTHALMKTRRGAWACNRVEEYKAFSELPFNILRLITYCALPFSIILFLNIMIIVRLRRTPLGLQGQETQQHTTQFITGATATQAVGSTRPRTSASRTHLRLTYMLLSVSISWVLLTAPLTLQTLIIQRNSDDKLIAARQELAKAVCYMFYYANHSINFFLYCITGNKFRRELVELFVKVFSCARRPWPVNSPSVRTVRSNCVEIENMAKESILREADPLRISNCDTKL